QHGGAFFLEELGQILELAALGEGNGPLREWEGHEVSRTNRFDIPRSSVVDRQGPKKYNRSLMELILGFLVIAAAIWALLRKMAVRLVLVVAGFVLGVLAAEPEVIVRTFLLTFSDERFVVPICTAMGFAHVVKHTGCDQHLIHLLLRPLKQVRSLL